jgi:23S rRNA maturation mini-RNase III
VLDQLEVSDKQRKAILALLAERDSASQKLWREMEPRMNALRAEFEPRFVAMMEKSKAQVRAQLNAKQLVVLDSMFQERREQRARQNRNSSDSKSPRIPARQRRSISSNEKD